MEAWVRIYVACPQRIADRETIDALLLIVIRVFADRT